MTHPIPADLVRADGEQALDLTIILPMNVVSLIGHFAKTGATPKRFVREIRLAAPPARERRAVSTLRHALAPDGSDHCIRTVHKRGYVALFEIISDHQVVVSALRHQREDDYH